MQSLSSSSDAVDLLDFKRGLNVGFVEIMKCEALVQTGTKVVVDARAFMKW